MGARASVTCGGHELEGGGPVPCSRLGRLGTPRHDRAIGSTCWGLGTKRQRGLCLCWPHPRQNSNPGSAAQAADSPTPGLLCVGCLPVVPFYQPTESHRLPRS